MSDRTEIEQAKARMPLPRLLRELGHPCPDRGGNIRSPLRPREKRPSFSVFQRNGSWGWKDHTTDQGGDEITLLEMLSGCPKAEAIRRYVDMAGCAKSPATAGDSNSAPPPKPVSGAPREPVDWPKRMAALSPAAIEKIARWRGFSVDFVAWLRARGLLGLDRKRVCLPVHGDDGAVAAVHIRGKGGGWSYFPRLEGTGVRPLVVRGAAGGQIDRLVVFESQWDMFAWLEVDGWHKGERPGWAAVCTRGASNGPLVCRPEIPEATGCYCVMQGDAAAQAWLAAIAGAFRGEFVFQIRPPDGIKDFNDWMKSGAAIDTGALVRNAEPVNRGLVPVGQDGPANAASPVAEKPPDPMDVLADKFALYWMDGSESFFLRPNGENRFVEMGPSNLRRLLKVDGIPSRAAEGETVSQMDRLLAHVVKHRSVEWAGSVSGYRAGVHRMHGRRVLVKDGPEFVEPKEGDWGVIRDLVEGRLAVPDFGAQQVVAFYGWLQCALLALLHGEHRPGQALIIAGPSDAGKSRLQHFIISPLLGGRHANPAPFLMGRTDFNSELGSAEHLLIEDMPSGLDAKSRDHFGEQLKNFVVGDFQRIHRKSREAMTLTPFWRVSVSANDNPDRLKVLPPVSSDLKDKVILLLAQASPFPMPTDSLEERAAFRAKIREQLPAFAWSLLHEFKIPEAQRSRRFWIKEFHHPTIYGELSDNEPENVLLLCIDQCLFEPSSREEWTGTALELQQQLTDEGSPCRDQAKKLFGYPTACGVYLARLADKHPGRVAKARSAHRREWKLMAPPPKEEDRGASNL